MTHEKTQKDNSMNQYDCNVREKLYLCSKNCIKQEYMKISLRFILLIAIMFHASIPLAFAQRVVLHKSDGQKIECPVSQLDSITFIDDIEHEWVDLGLPSGTLWATCNLGATKPEEYGDYFAWGELMPKEGYSIENYSFVLAEGQKELDATSDATTANCGSDWQIPSAGQFEELTNNTYQRWTTFNGINGELITSKTNGKSIFLPAADYRNESNYESVGNNGCYWTRSLYEENSEDARIIYFNNFVFSMSRMNRYCGCSIRPVRAITPNPSVNPKVRIGFYETIPGYSVKKLEFYADDTAATTQPIAILYNQGANMTFGFGLLNLDNSGGYIGKTISTASFAGEAADNYFVTMPSLSDGFPLTLRANYTLVSDDASGEIINVTGATTIIPAAYTAWKSGYLYTYIFKIFESGVYGLPDNIFSISLELIQKDEINSGGTTR